MYFIHTIIIDQIYESKKINQRYMSMAGMFKKLMYSLPVYYHKCSPESVELYKERVGEEFKRKGLVLIVSAFLGIAGSIGTALYFFGHDIFGFGENRERFSVHGTSSNGNCSPNIIGSTTSVVNCGAGSTEKPSISEIRDEIINNNRFPAYEIEGIEYRNGYQEENKKYVVVIAVNVKMLVSCDVMSKPGRGYAGKNDMDTVAVGLTSMMLSYRLGGDCDVGERFALLYKDEFLKTENGWVLLDQNSLGVERR